MNHFTGRCMIEPRSTGHFQIGHQCDGLHLDPGYARHDAHRLYLSKGLQFNCHHLALQFGQVT